jgi:pseudo-rSAM protein
MKNKKFLVIEPYVYISVDDNSVLFYNTLDSQHSIYQSTAIRKIVLELMTEENLYCREISTSEMNDPEILEFISSVKNNYYGDILTCENTLSRPIQFKSSLKIGKDLQSYYQKNGFSASRFLIDNVNEISIILNNKKEIYNQNFIDSFKQYDSVTSKNANDSILEIDSIVNLLKITYFPRLLKIKIITGLSSLEEQKDLFLKLFDFNNVLFELHFHYSETLQTNTLSYLSSLHNIRLVLEVQSPYDFDYLINITKILNNLEIPHKFLFIVKSDNDYKLFLDSILKMELKNYSIYPYYDRKNMDFFERNVFIKQSEILTSRPSMKNILAKTQINENHFGKLKIFIDGDVYLNYNFSSIGNIKKESFETIVSRMDFSDFEPWFIIRSKVEPCNSCLYKFLCPPISNYEYAMGKFNLCNNK